MMPTSAAILQHFYVFFFLQKLLQRIFAASSAANSFAVPSKATSHRFKLLNKKI